MMYMTTGTDKVDRLVGSEGQLYDAATIEDAVEMLREDVRSAFGDDAADEVDTTMLERIQLSSIVIDVDADFTNRLLPVRDFHDASTGDEYDSEFAGEGYIKATGQRVVIRWIQSFVKGSEPEDLGDLDWSNPVDIKLDE